MSLSPPALSTMDAKQREVILPLEDVAWVDSCLVQDGDILGKNWDAVKDALLDLMSSGLDSTSSSDPEIDSRQSEMGNRPSPISKQALPFLLPAQGGAGLILTENEYNDGGDYPAREEPSSPTNFRNVFQPNNKEFLEDMFMQDNELKLDDNVAGFSREDMFEVWDLDVPDKEGELFSQLQKALVRTSPRHPQESLPKSDGVLYWMEPVGDLAVVDDLVSGIMDLSL